MQLDYSLLMIWHGSVRGGKFEWLTQNIINKGLIFGVVPAADSLTYLAQDHAVHTLSWLAAVYYIQNIQCTQNEKLLQSAECENCDV